MQKANFGIFTQFIILVVLFAGIGFLLTRTETRPSPAATATSTTAAAAESATTPVAMTSPRVPEKSGAAATTTTSTTRRATTATVAKKPTSEATKTLPVATSTNVVSRVEQPYATSPLPLSMVNDATRSSIVNILCTTPTGLVRPISGSGVIVSPKGVILTNAHVAQYVLLSESAHLNLRCFVRTGSPAAIRWIPRVLYIPTAWVEAHASDITSSHALGTGEHDYALLYIADSANGEPLPAGFPSLRPDVRENIAFVDDPMLAAGYPAEFLGGLAATNDLYSASSATTVKQLLTFGTDSVDVLSLGGVIVAQSGSSGGAVVNMWSYLVGLVTTTSEGATTADRDLRAITLSYINRDITAQTGSDLKTILSGDPAIKTDTFSTNTAPRLLGLLLNVIFK